MVDIYEHIVDNDVLEKMATGKVVYYVCVNDKNAQTYKEGNLLTFKAEEGDLVVKAKIVRFLYFATLKELVNMLGRHKLGYRFGTNLDKLEDEYHASFGANKIDKYGFVAIEFALV